ncbi:hypothetical protein D3C78_449540 [compost metagenome]
MYRIPSVNWARVDQYRRRFAALELLPADGCDWIKWVNRKHGDFQSCKHGDNLTPRAQPYKIDIIMSM